MAFIGRFRELMKKYGKVAFGVHFSVSAASITGLYVAINNNVDVESVFGKLGISGVKKQEQSQQIESSDGIVVEGKQQELSVLASSGGALAMAVLCNKALLPVRVPITIALTPRIARFLAKQKIIKNQV